MSDMAKDDELDRAMMRNFGPPHSAAARAESIEPSSGFTASVMERVRAEAARAAAMGPIAFPWLRAVPGICMAVLALVVAATMLSFSAIGLMRLGSRALLTAAIQQGSGTPAWTELVGHLHLGWLLIALLSAFVPLVVSRGVPGRVPTPRPRHQ